MLGRDYKLSDHCFDWHIYKVGNGVVMGPIVVLIDNSAVGPLPKNLGVSKKTAFSTMATIYTSDGWSLSLFFVFGILPRMIWEMYALKFLMPLAVRS